jgi:imidazolonepropionase-like amidohydrolase
MRKVTGSLSCIVGALLAASLANAGPPELGPAVKRYVKVDAPEVALVHARVIDGTGAPARSNQTLIIGGGDITALGADGTVKIPEGALVIDLTGKSVIPGLVMMHEHLFYPTGPGDYGYEDESFTRLYLAGGVTSIRTAGNLNGYGDLDIKRSIDEGRKVGPWIDATAPYLDGASEVQIDQKYVLKSANDAERMVNFWADAGATSFKAYMGITRAELGAAIRAAHARGLKITAHLCTVTLREAAEMGIDNLEHTIAPATDFVSGKKPDVCPGQAAAWGSVALEDPNGPRVRALLADLVKHHVALTSTMTALEIVTPGRPTPPGIEVLEPALRARAEQVLQVMSTKRSGPAQPHDSLPSSDLMARLFKNLLAVDREFVQMGGLLMAGTDPSVDGVIPGFADQREVELLVEAGFTPEEAIRICSLNAATYLGRAARVGSIAAGKQADLVVIDGDPSHQVSDIRHVETVFKQGVGYDPAKLIDSVRGKVGLY